MLAPYMLAFTDDTYPNKLTFLDLSLNFVFFIDIVVNFFTATIDSRFDI
jgi:hypothetical protein